jgi:DNA helicase-2/ATP-dependent DNA helicase PcrA
VQPADDLAFERIVNVPRRGIGEATVKLLHDRARQKRIPLMDAAADHDETDDLNARTRTALRDLLAAFGRWRGRMDELRHTELAEIVLEESGYTEMWQADRSADAPGRLENLKELIRSMEEFDSMTGFLEHVSLVMDTDAEGGNDAVNIMTLHSAKGLEFDSVFLPGWEEGLFPSQRTLDESGRAGLAEERRLAYVGLTRARKRVYVRFASNRRMHGLWQTSLPSRFLDELPEAHVDVVEDTSSYGGYGMGGYGASRFDTRDPFENTYSTPGWQRAQKNRGQEGAMGGYGNFSGPKSKQRLIEGELVAKSVVTGGSNFSQGERIFHQKFGYGRVVAVEGNKLTVDFEKAGEKRVIDSFVERH